MPVYPLQTNFTAGELSPRLLLRVELNKYNNGVETMENFVVFPHGGTTRRAGTYFVKEVKDSTKETRLIPFEFSTTQAYILEFGDQYIRFYKDEGRIESPPGTPVEIASPYLEADLFDLKYAQSADTLYIVHQNYAPRKLTRTSHTAWTLSTVDFLDGPYLDENLVTPNSTASTITITPSAATGNGITLTASSALWASTDVGRLVRLKEGSVWGYAKIVGYTSSTVVTADVKSTLTNVNAKSTWRLGSWSTTTGFPQAITFFEQRLAFGGSASQPQTTWLSQSGDYEDFTPGTADSDALTYTLASNQVNVIVWLASSTALLIGTVGGEFALFGGNENPLTPTNVIVRKQSTHGSMNVSPVIIGNATLFVQRSGKKIRELALRPETGGFTATDLTLLSEHITDPLIYELSYQQEPDSIVWCVRDDGVLVSLTYNPTQEVLAFARHITDGFFESVATIPSTDGSYNQTWTVVRRTIGGNTKRYVEFFRPDTYVDSALEYSGVATTSVTGLDHLNGKTVKINGDGAVYPDEVVSGGSVTLDGPAAETIQVGLAFTPKIVTLRPEVKLPNGTSQGRPKRWAEVFIRMYQSLGLTVEGDVIPFRSAADPMDSEPPLYTGDKRISNSGWDQEGKLTFQQDQPLPCTILGYFGLVDIGGLND